MKRNFDVALEHVLKHEGGFVDHPKDPGGMTNLGVTRATLEQYRGRHVTEEEMRGLTPEDVGPLYKTEYWDRMHLDSPAVASGLDYFLFDFAVNSGTGRSAKYIQRIAGATADGAIGPKSLQAIGSLDALDAIEELYGARQRFYERLKTFETFGKGWTRRNAEVRKFALELAKAA
tara:strand:- start:2092 stop:2616 length:525 start_codon:yes stop_codon:yes gene_type:complete